MFNVVRRCGYVSLSVLCIHTDGYRTIVHDVNLHIGSEFSSCQCLAYELTQGTTESFIQGLADFVTGSPNP